jgi:GTP-binding protein
MKITSAKFIKGIAGTDALLEDHRPMVALVGRSNAGKSSLVNALVNRKDLARSSSRPGSTQEINVYLVNRDIYLLDLPGYGFVQKNQSWS